jgi:hypothetical protein
MRFMLFIYPPANLSDEDLVPDVETVAMMNRYNEELTKAGVLLALDGLHPASTGARITYDAENQPIVTDGPFAEAKEVVGGYWIIQTKTREEAVEWAKRAPLGGDTVLEVRQIWELADLPPEVQEAGALSQTPPEQTAG